MKHSSPACEMLGNHLEKTHLHGDLPAVDVLEHSEIIKFQSHAN